MTFRQLTYVVEIFKCGSINKASHKLFLSQSAISTAVRELEEELGIQFFVRNNRGVKFTPEGKEFLRHAISLLEQKKRIEALYGESQSTLSSARFAASIQRCVFAEDAFLQTLQATTENHFHFSLCETGVNAVINDVYDHHADVGVIFFTKQTKKTIHRLLDARNLIFHEIASIPPCIYVNTKHPLAAREQITEAELIEFPYVFFEQEPDAPVEFTEKYESLSLKKHARCISVNNLRMMLNVLSIPTIHAFATNHDLLLTCNACPDLVTIPIQDSSPIHLGLITPKNSESSALTRHFQKRLVQAVTDSVCFTEEL